MVLVNGKDVRPNYKVKALDEIIVYSDMSPEEMEIVPEEIPLNIVYEDEALMLINKAAGMVVHPGSGNYSGTLLNGVAWHLKELDPDFKEDTLPRFDWCIASIKYKRLVAIAKTDTAMRHFPNNFMIMPSEGNMWPWFGRT